MKVILTSFEVHCLLYAPRNYTVHSIESIRHYSGVHLEKIK